MVWLTGCEKSSAVTIAQAKTHRQKLFFKQFLSISLEFSYLFRMLSSWWCHTEFCFGYIKFCASEK